MRASYDAVIVGSGFGGGIAACRLAEAGWSVCVLERGRRFKGADFPAEPTDFPSALWHSRVNPHGLFDVRLMRDVATVTAAGVGGGSLVYANVQLRAPDEVFDHGWPAAVTREALEPWYDRTEKVLEAETTPAVPALAKVRAFQAMAVAAGSPSKPLPLAVHFGKDRANPFGQAAQSGCKNLGRCVLGCPIGAKNTIDITYLARAELAGAEVHPLHEARRLQPPARAGQPWTVGFKELAGRQSGQVSASTLILAAGTLGTTRLLLSNRRRLPKLSSALGSCFSGNGDALGMAFDPAASGVVAAEEGIGPTMTSYVDHTADRRLIVADGGLPGEWSFVFRILRGYNTLRGWRRALLHVKNAGAMVGLGSGTLRPRDVRLCDEDPIENSLVFMIFGRDAANGQMRLTPLLRRFDIRWSRNASRRLFDDMQQTVNELAAAVGAQPFFALNAGPLGKYVTVHPLGGCPMGDDPQLSVADDLGRVHGYERLLIVDGSVIPTALGVNPSKTIAALAERSVSQLAQERTP
jgi:cholesterol oxidase